MKTNDSKIDKLLNIKDLQEILKIGRTQVWNLRRAGKLPMTVKLGSSVRWRASDIYSWLDLGCPPLHKFEQMKKVAG